MVPNDEFRGYRRWFYAAAVYNVIWGLAVILFPTALFRAVSGVTLQYPSLFQCIGMMVLVYGPGYYLIAKDPIRYGRFVWIGILGKTFGPLGFVCAALKGELPWAFGFNLLFNDVLWWPAFWSFALKYAREPMP